MSARIRILTTGGTIASRPDPRGGVSVAVPGHELVTGAGPAVRAEVREVMLAHSFNLTLSDVLRLAGQILAELRGPTVNGVVVAHGTDTMEETAYLLDLLLPPEHTAVFTGAQRHAAEPDRDGPRNLADAVRVAADPAARGLGALITMAGLVHAARHATKAHTLSPEAFASPAVGRSVRSSARGSGYPAAPCGPSDST
ncbi:asparaginase [Streptosporangium lutulentum]